jgi:hypothetical protein
MAKRISEREEADKLAERLLNVPNADPDDDLRMLSRQLLRRREVIDRMEKVLAAQQDGTRDMIEANRDSILRIHEQRLRKIRDALNNVGTVLPTSRYEWVKAKIEAILDAVNSFHPMHGESWPGWPK